MSSRTLDINALETWLWEAACKLRGTVDAPKYKDFILPLAFLERLSDVFEDEVAALSQEFGAAEVAASLVEQDHSLVRFYLPEIARWPSIAAKTIGLGEHLTDAMRAVARENPRLAGVIDATDFNATTSGQRVLSDAELAALVQVLGQYRLGLSDVEPDIFGRAYEYLLRKFAEGSGQSAGSSTRLGLSLCSWRICSHPIPAMRCTTRAAGRAACLSSAICVCWRHMLCV